MMKCKFEAAVFIVGCCLFFSDAAPVSLVTAEGSEPDAAEMPEELVLDEDDSTTHNFERLVSAATCLVAGVEYTHGQQIYRKDPCEFCLCLDGEMFCWWQDCPPISEGPCKDRRPFSACANGGDKFLTQSTTLKSNTARSVASAPKLLDTTTTTEETDNTWGSAENETTSDSADTDSTFTEMDSTQNNVEVTTQTTAAPTVCVVMGTEYKIGEMLPHDTGNCLECVCGQGARVTCSPHHCAPPGDDSADYRPPGPRPDRSDTF